MLPKHTEAVQSSVNMDLLPMSVCAFVCGSGNIPRLNTGICYSHDEFYVLHHRQPDFCRRRETEWNDNLFIIASAVAAPFVLPTHSVCVCMCVRAISIQFVRAYSSFPSLFLLIRRYHLTHISRFNLNVWYDLLRFILFFSLLVFYLRQFT